MLELGLTAEMQDDDATAATWFQRMLAGHRAQANDQGVLLALTNLGDAAYRLGRFDDAGSLSQEALLLADALHDTRLGCMVRSNLGQIELHNGDVPAAWSIYDEAMRLALTTRNDLLIADVLAGMAGVALAQDRVTECGLLLGASRGFCERFGSQMIPHHGMQRRALDVLRSSTQPDTVDRLLAEGQACPLGKALDIVRRLDPRVPAAPEYPCVAGLTARELAVLNLLAAGMSDRAIGAELFISHRTAMRHVSAIFRKLGVHNRAAAAEIAQGHLSYSATHLASESGR
jgi:DNA-binding NarL/FixJ family response regulator